MRNRLLPASLILTLLIAEASVAADAIELPVTMDNSIVMVDGEWSENAGQQGRIRIKGNQHAVAMGFDTSAIGRRLVRKATLVCVQGEQMISGVSLSTIATPWSEAKSNGLTAGMDGIADWGYEGARFPAISGGNSFTMVHSVMSEIRDGKYHWDVPPDMVHAMHIGVAHGLAIHEHDADYGRNPTIFSREQSGRKPVLIVEVDESQSDDAAPQSAVNLQVVPVSQTESRLQMDSPQHGFAYEVLIDGKPLGRHNIPLILSGQSQSIPLRDLPASIVPGKICEIHVVTLNRTGQRSAPAVARSVVLKQEKIETPEVPLRPKSSPAFPGLSVIPVTDKYDETGKSVGTLPEDYRIHNAVFDGSKVFLSAAAGEVSGFQLLLRGTDGVSSGQVAVKVDLPAEFRVDLHHAVYVTAGNRRIPDPLLPMPKTISLSSSTDQVVIADIYVPFDAVAGVRKGQVSISDGRTVPLEIEVLPFALPRKATFLCEMNGYGLPDHVDEYYALQQIAYDHRVHSNILHYSHNTAAAGVRKSNLDMRLRSGRRMDNRKYDDIQPNAEHGYWDDFIEAFGPFIDGSLFQNGHRGPIPAPGFYLTFHESWPLNCRPYFNGSPDAYQAFSDQPAYAKTYVNILADFMRVAESKGWTQTGFQVYFNNKGSLKDQAKAPWILDEPSAWWDYRALQFYGELTDQGKQKSSEVPVSYRVDISRPEYCRGQLSQRDDLWVVSSWAFEHYRRLVTDRMERDGLRVWIYGTSNHVHETNRNILGWALDAWQHGATGLVPWQTVNKTGSAMTEADQLGLFIFDKDEAGKTVIRHSMRLKAYREVQQCIEYLNLLQQKRSWSHEQMRQFVGHYTILNAQVSKVNEEDAGTTAYGQLSANAYEKLRRAAADLLSQK